ncbi:hypothetical protein AFLA_009490 [Aspergillus flavus NRRL3357]|nr:hypothetical protein AFLA_009490 [Aspergillus flavus NRRL3357]
MGCQVKGKRCLYLRQTSSFGTCIHPHWPQPTTPVICKFLSYFPFTQFLALIVGYIRLTTSISAIERGTLVTFCFSLVGGKFKFAVELNRSIYSLLLPEFLWTFGSCPIVVSNSPGSRIIHLALFKPPPSTKRFRSFPPRPPRGPKMPF